MTAAAQQSRLDARVAAEVQADPFAYALRELRRIDAEERAAFDSFMAASRETREAFDIAMRELRNV